MAKMKYIGKKTLIEKGTVCTVSFRYNPGFEEYMATAVVPPYGQTVTLYYDSAEERSAEWEPVQEDGE